MRSAVAVAVRAENGQKRQQVTRVYRVVIVEIGQTVVGTPKQREENQQIGGVDHTIKVEIALTKRIGLVKAVGENVGAAFEGDDDRLTQGPSDVKVKGFNGCTTARGGNQIGGGVLCMYKTHAQ